ncbi:MAG TPA: tobH protein [Aldersonia sp.]
MTALSVLDLDDAASLEAADSLGTLRSAALGGAHVRAVAEGVREDALGRLAGVRPRALLLVTGPGRARRAAGMLVAALGAHAGLPIVHVTTTPTWVGPLDVVLISGDDAGDPRLVESVAIAVRRGAEVVVAAPDEGPLRAAGAGRVIALPPRIRTTGRGGIDPGALLRYLAAGLAVATVVDATRSVWTAEELDRLADAVDAEAMRDHPVHEVFDNPAKSLAARLRNRRVVLAGDGPATVELAAHGAEVLLRAVGTVAAAADLADVLAGASMLASAKPPGADFDPFFHDEQIDGPAPQEGVRVFVLGMTADRNAIARRLRVLEDAEVVTVGEGEDRTPAAAPPAAASSDVEQLAMLALRLEMAAAYLGLLRGPGVGAASAPPPALVPPSPTEGEPV